MDFLKDPRIQNLSPKIIPTMALRLLGCVFYGDPFHSAKEWSYDNEIGHLWTRFFKIFQKYHYILEKINLDPDSMFEVHIEPVEYKETKKYNVFIGISINQESDIPMDLFLKPFPPTQYLSFATKTTEHDEAEYIFRHWLMNPKTEYTQAYPFIIQRYNQKKYRGLEDPSSEIEWMIPIKIRNQSPQELPRVGVDNSDKSHESKSVNKKRQKK